MLLFCLLWCLAQEDESLENAEIRVDYTTTVTMVNLPIKILSEGEPYKGLELSDLQIIENGIQVELAMVRRVKTPLTTHFLFDLSISNERHLLNAKKSVREITGKMKTGDLSKISVFSGNYLPLTDYTADRKTLYSGLSRLAPAGSTAIYDAISAAIDELKGVSGSRVLILFSDGYDLMSHIEEGVLRNKVRNHGIPIIFVTFSNGKKKPPLLAAQLKYLEDLALESGGAVVDGTHAHTRDLASVIRRQRFRYMARFAPPGPDDLEQWRSLSVQISNCDDCRLEYRRAYQLKPGR